MAQDNSIDSDALNATQLIAITRGKEEKRDCCTLVQHAACALNYEQKKVERDFFPASL
jgi:hypothetical protein